MAYKGIQLTQYVSPGSDRDPECWVEVDSVVFLDVLNKHEGGNPPVKITRVACAKNGTSMTYEVLEEPKKVIDLLNAA